METPGWSAAPPTLGRRHGLRRRQLLRLGAGLGTATLAGALGACGGSPTGMARHAGPGPTVPAATHPVGTAMPAITPAPSAAVTFSI